MADNVARGLAMQALGRIPKTTSADAGKLATVDSNGEWTAAELEVGHGEVAVDSTLLVSGAAADAMVTGDKLGELKSAIDDVFTTKSISSDNIFDPTKANAGYYWTDGWHSSGSYVNTGLIPVEADKTYTLQTGYLYQAASRQLSNARFVVYYEEDGETVAGYATYATNLTIPNDAAFVVASYNYTSVEGFLAINPAVFEGTTVRDYEPYVEPYTEIHLNDSANSPQTGKNTQDIASLFGKSAAIFSATANTLAANTNLICCDSCDNKKNEYIELTANFSTFGELTIAHGKSSYGGGYITITDSKINVFEENGTLLEEFEHGLTLYGFINVIIYTKNDSTCRSSITITTAGGDYTADTTRYYSSRAAVLCNATFAMTNVTLKYTVNDAKERVWVFGDSYISMGDPNRWASQMILAGHKNALLCGFGGAQSSAEIYSFRNLIAETRPAFVCWCLGMNDGDTDGQINASWKSCVDEVVDTCEAIGVVPVLATIPNVPDIVHTYKNAYVKASGKRYIDFAKAVNAESEGATWYTGMLSDDETHPTALGAKVLMRQFLLDVPEVLYAEE